MPNLYYQCVKDYHSDTSDLLQLKKGDHILHIEGNKNATSCGRGKNLRTGNVGQFSWECVVQMRAAPPPPTVSSMPSLVSSSTSRLSSLSTRHLSHDSGNMSETLSSSSSSHEIISDVRQSTEINARTQESQSATNTLIPRPQHDTTLVAVSFPLLCSFCSDFVISLTPRVTLCTSCRCVVHERCASAFASTPCLPSSSNDLTILSMDEDTNDIYAPITDDSSLIVSKFPISLETLDADNVLQWLVATNLGRYSERFRKKRITGAHLAALTPSYRGMTKFPIAILDPFHKAAFIHMVNQLQNEGDVSSPYLSFKVSPSEKHTHSTASHGEMRLKSFHHQVVCSSCSLNLIGVMRQGFQCVTCGSIFHRICLSHNTLPPCLPSTKPVNSIFGLALERQVSDDGSSSVPPFLSLCVECLEACVEVSPIDCYSQTSSSIELEELTNKMDTLNIQNWSDNNECVSSLVPILKELSPTELACLIKLYLKELPNSLWPEEFYERGVQAVRDINESVFRVATLIGSIPPHHQDSLKFFLKHLLRVGSLSSRHRSVTTSSFSPTGAPDSPMVRRSSSSSDQSISQEVTPKSKLSSIFWNIVIRPLWSQSPKHAGQSSAQLSLFKSLLVVCETNAVPAPGVRDSKGVLSSIPTRSSSRASPAVGSVSGSPARPVPPPKPSKEACSQRKSLQENEWYWGDCSRNEVFDLLEGMDDGSFIVRNSLDKAGYTLSFRCNGETRSIRISQSVNGCYGFTEFWCEFPSVQALIEYYTVHPLTEYKLNLRTNLSNPVSRNSSTISGSLVIYTTGELVDLLEEMDSQFHPKNERLDVIMTKMDELQTEMDTITRQIGIHTTINAWYMDQFKVFINCRVNSNTEKVRLHSMGERVKNATGSISKALKSYQEQLEEMKVQMQDLREENDIIMSEGQKLVYKRSRILDYLIGRGMSKQLLEMELDHQLYYTKLRISIDPAFPINIEKTWRCEHLDRAQSDAALINMECGTFLVRQSTAQKKLVLVVKIKDNYIEHCIIHQNQSGKYGLVEGHCFFKSVHALVSHYHFHSLKPHNPNLDINLKYPINASVEDMNKFYAQ